MYDPSIRNLACFRGYTSHRESSWDRTGANRDGKHVDHGQTLVLADLKGPGVITHIWIGLSHPDPMHRRNMVLRMFWDDEPQPSVLAPLGDFFGQGWGETYEYATPLTAASPKHGRALNCFFPMPFASSARIEIENQSEKPCDAFYYYVDYEKHADLPEDLARFHAQWRRERTLPEAGAPGTDRHPDNVDRENEWAILAPEAKNPTDRNNYVFLEAEGRGHYVGVHYFVDNPSPMWPGEGDDMFVIDGKPWPPDLHGTGTEDYFCCAWSPRECFTHPCFGYARVNSLPDPYQGRTGWLGRTHAYRFHLESPVTFKKSIRASIEHGHANALVLDIATVAYWYQSEPHKPFPDLPDVADRQNMPPITEVEILRWRDAWRKQTGGGPLWGHETK